MSDNKHDKQIPGVISALLGPIKSMHIDRKPNSLQQNTPSRPMPTSIPNRHGVVDMYEDDKIPIN